MDSGSVPKLIADTSLGGAASLVAIMTIIRVVLLVKSSKARVAAAEIFEAALIAITLLFFVIQPFVGKTYYIPSGSMRPTLEINDHVVVDKLSYRFRQPSFDDIVVFVAPSQALSIADDSSESVRDNQPIDYVKRVIGLPGDTIVVHHGYILINGLQETHAAIRRALGLTDPDVEHVKIETDDLLVTNGSQVRYTSDQIDQLFGQPGAKIEYHPGRTIRNGKVLDEPYIAEDPAYDFKVIGNDALRIDPDDEILYNGASPDRAQMALAQHDAPGKVMEGHILVMGDNRNDSNDSTLWGLLDENAIVGRTLGLYYPLNRMRAIK